MHCNPVNCCKKTGFFFKRTKQGNSCGAIEAGAEQCRLDQWTRLSCGDGGKAEESYVRTGTLEGKSRIRANGLERLA